jgi:hypothetical protein
LDATERSQEQTGEDHLRKQETGPALQQHEHTIESPLSEERRSQDAVPALDKALHVPLAFNLLSTLFYITNYYIASPSATAYVNALGRNDALSATLIGAMPFAALLTSFPYSWWTNYSFKEPLIFTVVVLGVGNLLYASALKTGSLNMALLGRFLMGFGHQRTINKRFMADTIPATHKTAVSSGFSICQAAGMSLGPGIAIALGLIDVEIGPFIFNALTLPGYFMFAVWFIYALFLIVLFRDPKRTGLHELKARENRQRDEAAREREDILEIMPEEPPQETGCGGCALCIEAMSAAIFLVMFLMFSNKFAIEMVISSASTLTKNRYGWGINQVGILGVADGIMVIPLSGLVGWLSHRFEDRTLMNGLLALSALGLALLVDPTDFLRSEESYNSAMPFSVGPTQYVIGSLLSFASLQACESIITSQLSKVVPHSLAKGTFNSGLLSTLVGAVSSVLQNVNFE